MIRDVSIEITQKCPNKCLHCSSSSDISSSAIISFEKVKEIVDGLIKLGVMRICLSGGEPFLHNRIKDIVRYICEKNIRVDIYSSGIALENNNACSIDESLLLELKNLGLKRIMFNMQATDEEVYNQIMNTKGYYKFLLQSIKNTKKAGLETEIHFVPTKINYNQIDNIICFAEKEEINQISFLRLVSHGRAQENSDTLLLTDKENDLLKDRLIKMKERYRFIRIGIPLGESKSELKCHSGKTKLYIKFDGSVFGCEAFKYLDLYNESNIKTLPDNIHNKNIYDIFNNSEYLIQQNNFIKCNSINSGCGENCPVQYYMRQWGYK